jgi:hypothetical protein
MLYRGAERMPYKALIGRPSDVRIFLKTIPNGGRAVLTLA